MKVAFMESVELIILPSGAFHWELPSKLLFRFTQVTETLESSLNDIDDEIASSSAATIYILDHAHLYYAHI